MKFNLKANTANYAAKIVKLPVPSKHPNADRLQVVTIDGNTVITGMNAKEGDVYVYFPVECRISHEFLSHTDSYSEPTLNKNTTVKGFFPSSGRVKAVKLRSMPSMGYVVPIGTFLAWVASFRPELVTSENPWSFVGTEFDHIGDVFVCEKYIPKTQSGAAFTPRSRDHQVARHRKVIEGQFRFHIDTAHLRKNLHRINPEDVITVSYKLHGTSAVFAKVLCSRRFTLRERIAKWFGCKIQETYYDYLYSSRSVIKNGYEYDKKVHNHFYGKDIWAEAFEKVKPSIKDGFTLYAEVVGYTSNGRHIQKGYDYGCKQGESDIYIYRITYTNASHEVFELSYPQIERYCQMTGLKTVPILYHGRADGLVAFSGNRVRDEDLATWRGDLNTHLTSRWLEKECHMCVNKVPGEGVVVAVESHQFTPFKLKSFAFLEGESKQLDSGEVDIETEQAISNEQ